LPENAPSEYTVRAALWNAVEKCERNANAQLAREIELALPVELSKEQNVELVRSYVKDNFTAAGMCADICIHDKGDGNPHAHIMLTIRPFDGRRAWAAKSRKEYLTDENGERIRLASGNFKTRKIPTVDWNEQSKAEQWREAWSSAANAALEEANAAVRIDHRSYQRQGIEQIPTVHMGVAATQMERRGIPTERGATNRQIELTNRELKQTRARINKLSDWLKSEAAQDATPTLEGILAEILESGTDKTRYAKIHDLKSAALLLNYLQSNRIATLPELQERITEFYGRLSDVSEKLKPIERRLKTLDEHIKYSEVYGKNHKVYEQFKAQKPKNREAFYITYRAEITLYEAAARYLKDHLYGRTQIPLKAWQTERIKLTAEKSKLNSEYQTLKSEIKGVETIRKYAEDIQLTITPPQKTKKQELDR
jgi:hypothetical protein